MLVKPNIENNWVGHHDNMNCHKAISINETLASKNNLVIHQPPYLPTLNLYDFLFFRDWKKSRQYTYFDALKNIKKATIDYKKNIPVSELQHCYED